MIRLACLAIGYAFGMIQTGYLVGRYHKTDIRQHGSGNAGTTNALRTFGKRAAVITLLGDVLKSILAILLVRALFHGNYSDILPMLCVYTGAGCVLGHNFPCYLGFRGGKGIATSLGMIIALDWRIALMIAVLFVVILVTTHYVSVGSLACYTFGVVCYLIISHRGAIMSNAHLLEMDAVLVCLLALACFRHRANLSRLVHGTENKTYLSKRSK